MDRISYEFNPLITKYISIILSFCIGTGIIIYILFSFIFYNTISSTGMLLALTFSFISFLFSYLLIKSKNLFIDNSFFIIAEKGAPDRKIPVYDIKKIQRILFFFYLIRFKNENNESENVIFFISFNPPLFTPEKIQHLKSIK